MTRYAVFLLPLAVAACASGPAPTSEPCAGWLPIRPTLADVDTMSEALVDQVLSHNEHGARVCGWK